MHFLLWTKEPHENTNFDTFKCASGNLQNSSCHFPKHNWGFLQISLYFSVSWKITSVYFFRSNVIYLAWKRPFKLQIFETFECLDQNPSSSCHFWNRKLVFVQILHHSSLSWDIAPLYIFSWNFIYFQQKEPITV